LIIDANEKLTLENGYLEAIDNNGDGLRDVVFINEYLNGRVDRAKDNYVYFKDLVGKIKALELDKNNSNVAFSIEDVNGKAMELKDIKEDDIISLFSSSDASVLKLIVSDKIVEGRIEEIRENKIVIDGTEYKVSKELKLKAGDEITAFLDFKGVVADFEFVKEKASQYGYVTGYIKDGLDYVVKVIMPGEFKEEMVSNLDEENPIMTAVLRGKNSNVAVYTLASKVNIIDETGSRKVDSDKLGSFFGVSNDGILKTQRVIKYKLDSNGVIKSIETPKRIYDPLIGIDQKKTYNSYEKVFGKSGNIAFGADEHTNVLCIPDDKGVSSDNDYFATIDINNNSQYTISGFDMDEETEIADLIVITTTMDVDAEGTIDNKNEFAVVQEAATVFNEETGETEIALSIYNKGILQKRSIADIPEVLKIAENLKYGDVIYFADDADKVINKLKIIAELGNASQLYSQGSSSNEKFLLGKVDTIEFGKIDDVLNRRVNMVKAITDETSNISSEILLNERNPLPLYLVDNTGNKQSVSVIEPDEIRPNGEDKIFAHIVNYKLKCAVIVRD
ncbi:MAG: hypothetical protein RSA27_08295, partial [Oscillospiraceae bacterium]